MAKNRQKLVVFIVRREKKWIKINEWPREWPLDAILNTFPIIDCGLFIISAWPQMKFIISQKFSIPVNEIYNNKILTGNAFYWSETVSFNSIKIYLVYLKICPVFTPLKQVHLPYNPKVIFFVTVKPVYKGH